MHNVGLSPGSWYVAEDIVNAPIWLLEIVEEN